jgi:serine protease Do
MVRIEATGTFNEPSGGGPRSVGHGSGFIVDPSGIILTYSHVVTGAKTVTVWVGSELTKQTADVRGVSECSDLAVIQLKGRENLPYLKWYEPAIKPGLPIHAAGYPLGGSLGGSKPSVIGGKVSSAPGVTAEARLFVADTIELNANIPADSSGGPIVTNDGQIVGVNYPSDDATKPFAISRDEVQRVLPVLQAGGDAKSVGINGYAQESNPAGIWVVAVKPDSPAARARILPGDVVTELDGKSMAVNGTMAEYCGVLSGYEEGDPLSFTVYREESRATLKGALNGDPVEPGFAFVDAVGWGISGPRSATRDEPVRGSPGTLYVEVPTTWSDRKDWAWSFGDKRVGPGLFIASDVNAFRVGYRTPGAYIGASATLAKTTLEAVLDSKRSQFTSDTERCKLIQRAKFTRGGYTGIYDLWKSCKDEASRFLTVAASKAGSSDVVYIEFLAAETADLAILDRMLVTLKFDPNGV